MKGIFGIVSLLLMLLFTSSILRAFSRNTFVLGEESIEKPRMLRGVSLNDYDDVSANPGHDPGNHDDNRGGNGAPSNHDGYRGVRRREPVN